MKERYQMQFRDTGEEHSPREAIIEIKLTDTQLNDLYMAVFIASRVMHHQPTLQNSRYEPLKVSMFDLWREFNQDDDPYTYDNCTIHPDDERELNALLSKITGLTKNQQNAWDTGYDLSPRILYTVTHQNGTIKTFDNSSDARAYYFDPINKATNLNYHGGF